MTDLMFSEPNDPPPPTHRVSPPVDGILKVLTPKVAKEILTSEKQSLSVNICPLRYAYVMRARVPSTLSRYGVTIRGNVTSVYPPLEKTSRCA
jgi:hypothetical protein